MKPSRALFYFGWQKARQAFGHGSVLSVCLVIAGEGKCLAINTVTQLPVQHHFPGLLHGKLLFLLHWGTFRGSCAIPSSLALGREDCFVPRDPSRLKHFLRKLLCACKMWRQHCFPGSSQAQIRGMSSHFPPLHLGTSCNRCSWQADFGCARESWVKNYM